MAIAKYLATLSFVAAAIFQPTQSLAGPVHAEMFDVPYVCSITFTIRSGRDGLRGGEYDGDVYANIEIADHWYPLSRDRTGLNVGARWAAWSTHIRTVVMPECLALDDRLQAIRLHTRFAGGVFGNNWDMIALTIGWSGHMTSKRGGGLRTITGYFYRGARGPALCRFSGERHDFDVAITH